MPFRPPLDQFKTDDGMTDWEAWHRMNEVLRAKEPPSCLGALFRFIGIVVVEIAVAFLILVPWLWLGSIEHRIRGAGLPSPDKNSSPVREVSNWFDKVERERK